MQYIECIKCCCYRFVKKQKKKTKQKQSRLMDCTFPVNIVYKKVFLTLFAILAQCLLRLVENGKRNWERPQEATDFGLAENIEYFKQHYVLTASESCWWYSQRLVTVWTVSLYLQWDGLQRHTCLLRHTHHISVGVTSSGCRKHLKDIWQTVTHQ